ncbi:hypothetical protein [Paracoccus sp. S1E-3]|uniref:hypothetical protein n=1 Tax=Paracoccus sp. S1E-3 TaxID=2756130 RepID=UPI0015EF6204|nr:hypothetical protein [Paracoccus sp. S1E-3]MBA4489976.1 hypothetical protein [Paracoccus sp. S1E-3]
MSDCPRHSHYNHDDPTYAQLSLASSSARGREALDQLRRTPRAIFRVWLVRVAIMAAALWILNDLLGPFGWTWWALPGGAVVWQAMTLMLNALKNRKPDRLGYPHDERDARHFR